MTSLEDELGFQFFDSNVLIADAISGHPHHDASSRLLSSLSMARGAIAAHSLAVAYKTLLDAGRLQSASRPGEVVEHSSHTYSVVTLTASETVAALAKAADMGLSGAVIYDALIIRAQER